MMQTTKAVVLRTVKITGGGIITDVLTADLGRVSFVQRATKGSRGRGTANLLQPMTLVELSLDHRAGQRLQRNVQVRLWHPYTSIPFDAYKLSIAMFLSEFIYYCTRAEQTNAPLFDYLVASLRWLDAAPSRFANFHLVFMMRLSRFVGFYPNLDDYTSGCFFDLRNACYTLQRPTHADFLEPTEATHISLLMRMNYETMHLFRLSRSQRNRIADLLMEYYRLHVPGFPELHSLSVLRELFA